MDSDLLFRVLFVGVYSIFGAVRVAFRIQASGQPGRRESMGWAGFLVSVNVLCLLVAVVLYPISPEWMRWSQLGLPDIVRWIGVLLALAMTAMLFWTHRTLGRMYSACLEIRSAHRLVTTGPYRRVRHPMYAVFCGFTISMALISANALLLLLSVVLVYPLRLVAIREEKMMLGTFGQEYRDYMQRTGRFVPRLR